jgi:hypothetical protein
MPSSFEYAVVRVVPRVEREEFVNVGVALFCLSRSYLAARVEVDAARLGALWPQLDLELVQRHLEAIPRLCAGGAEAGPLGRLTLRERWHWLVAPRSSLIQLGPAHAGLCEAPEATLDRLFDQLVRVPRTP